MKKHFLILLMVSIATSVMAIDTPNRGLGIQIGWAQPILRLNSPSNPASAKDSLSQVAKLNGLKVGLVYDASYIAGFGSSMGLNYTFAASNSGWQSDNTYGMPYPRKRQMIAYNEIEVFVDWQYKFELARETYLILYTGPTIQCGLEMHMRADHQAMEGMDIVRTYYNAYQNDNPNQLFTRLNVTWGVGAGFQFKRYFLRGGYDFGLINPYANRQFVDALGNPIDRYTRGRLDQWSIKIGMYMWYED